MPEPLPEDHLLNLLHIIEQFRLGIKQQLITRLHLKNGPNNHANPDPQAAQRPIPPVNRVIHGINFQDQHFVDKEFLQLFLPAVQATGQSQLRLPVHTSLEQHGLCAELPVD